ncbi:hypothetical protein DPMN_027936 [Dreissena polymorpha]|uniref:Uncharacterized protein n=1 Tax=Dreissena polymorpha TaxID=45954 RepID=A0A9D4LWA0_DREPO|nr:hypothetical protein DPMN_027936 [Dreissena polymorpha]
MFYEDRTINVVSRGLIRKNSPPRGGHVFQPTRTIFKFVQDIIVLPRKNAPPPCGHVFRTRPRYHGDNLLTTFHEDQKINVAFRMFTRQMLTPHDAHRTTDKSRSQMLIMCSGEQTK